MVRLDEAMGAVIIGRTVIKIPVLVAEPQLPEVTILLKYILAAIAPGEYVLKVESVIVVQVELLGELCH